MSADNEKTELRIRYVSKKLVDELNAIRKNEGYDNLTIWLKATLKKVADSYPERFKIFKD